MNTLLTAANGLLQYHRGKQTGLAGLMGLIFTIIIVFQWNHILPFFENIGLIQFFRQHGMIYEGDPGRTGFAFVLLAYKICIAFALVLAVFIVIALLLAMLGSSKLGIALVLGVLMVLYVPFFFFIWIPYYFLSMRFDFLKTKKRKREEAYQKEYFEQFGVMPPKDDFFKTTEELFLEDNEEISKDEVLKRLNRIPTYGDNQFLIGKSGKDTFVLLPTPFITIDSEYAYKLSNSMVTSQVSYEKSKDIQYNNKDKSDYFYPKKKLDITSVEEQKWKLEIRSTSMFDTFYVTKNKEFQGLYNTIANQDGYKEYCDNAQKRYFNQKSALLKRISSAQNKSEFDKYVSDVKEFNASNEEIVKIMMESNEKIGS